MSESNANNELTPEHITQLRADADKGRLADAAIAKKDREIAFLRAGVDPGSLIGRNIIEAHGDTDITPELIAATTVKVREELGLPPVAGQPQEEGTPPLGSPEAQVANIQQQLHGGAAPAGAQPTPKEQSLIDMAVDTYLEGRKSGLSDIESQEAGIGEIIRAAANGNVQARYSRDAHAVEAAKHGHGAEFAGLPERSYAKVPQTSK